MNLRTWMRALTCIAALVLAPSAVADQPRDARYGGVVPGSAATTPPAAPKGAWSNLTWLGFLPDEAGGARVFAQIGREVRVEQAIVDGELWVMLDRVRPASRNATRLLDVRFFDTGLATIRAERISRRERRGDRPAQPDGMRIVVSFLDSDRAREAVVSIVREQDGYHYLYLEFEPQGSTDNASG